MLAIGAISALSQHGIRVPESISIAGFDNLLEARYIIPPLTTMEVSKYELGQISVRMILDLIRGSNTEAISLETKSSIHRTVERTVFIGEGVFMQYGLETIPQKQKGMGKPAKRLFLKRLVQYRALLVMLLPAVLYFVIFYYLPMAGIIVTFKKYDYVGGIFGSPWAGLDNFKFLFINGQIFKVIRNTVLYNLAFIVINTVVEVAVAIMLAEIGGKFFKKLTQSVMFLPYFISWVVVGAFVYNLFNNEFGFFNTILKALNLAPVNIFDKPFAWAIIIVVFGLWKNLGYGSVIYIASIAGINRELYEAAEIDGAKIMQRIRYITLPAIAPTIVILVLLSIGNIFRGDFSMFYQIVGQNSLVYDATDVIDTFVVRSLTQVHEFGMTSAAGLVQSVLCFAIINIANYAVRKVDSDYALF